MTTPRSESGLQRMQRKILRQQDEQIKRVTMAVEFEIRQEDREIQAELEKQDMLEAE